jgi:hypothetical protein
MTAERRFSCRPRASANSQPMAGIQPVVGPEKRQSNPGPVVIHG